MADSIVHPQGGFWWYMQRVSSSFNLSRGAACTHVDHISIMQWTMFEKKKREQTLARIFTETSSPASYPAIKTRTNIRHAVFWLFAMFTESQIKASERDPEYCKKGCEIVKRCSWGTCDTGSRSLKRLQFIHCACSHQHVCPRSKGNNSPVFFFSGTGLLWYPFVSQTRSMMKQAWNASIDSIIQWWP